MVGSSKWIICSMIPSVHHGRRNCSNQCVITLTQMLQDVVDRGEQPAQAFCELGWGDGGGASR